MPQFDTTVTLQTVANVLKKRYYDEFLEFETISGKTTNDLFTPADLAVLGDGTEFKYKRSMADSWRSSKDAMNQSSTSRPFVSEKLTVRFNERDYTVNDFTKMSGSVRVSQYQLDKASTAGEAAIVDLVDELDKDFRKDYNFKQAVMRNMDRTNRLGTVNGTKKNNTSLDLASCTTYTASSTSCRFAVDDGAIGWFREGQYLDIYNSSGTLILDNVIITDEPNAGDLSVGIAITSETTAAANCDGISDNHEMFWSGSRNQGMFSIGELFNTPASGYIGGVDRTAVAYRALQARIFRGASGTVARKISKTDFDTVGDTLAAQYDMPDIGYATRMQQNLHTALRSQFEAAALIPWPTDKESRKRYANYGSHGLTYMHPSLGLLKLEADPFMKPGRFQMMGMEDFLALYYQNKGLRILPGAIGGNWERMQSETVGEGKTLVYEMQGMSNVCDFCTFPRRQVETQNLLSA